MNHSSDTTACVCVHPLPRDPKARRLHIRHMLRVAAIAAEDGVPVPAFRVAQGRGWFSLRNMGSNFTRGFALSIRMIAEERFGVTL